MTWALRKPFVVAFYGTSLTTGRLSTFWPEYLREILKAMPEAVGNVLVYNLGKGSQTSDWGAANAYTVAEKAPDLIVSEDFTINDCADGGGGPAVSEVDQLANMEAMHDEWTAANPAVVIVWQSMNSVSVAGAAIRPTLAARYAAAKVKALALGDDHLDNYGGAPTPPGVVGGWPKPLPDYLTNEGDGLHPILTGGTDTYLIPNVLFRVREAMADFWGLDPPNPPDPPPLPDAQYLVVPGGAGGGGFIGGGGGAGKPRRGEATLSALFGPVLVGSAGLGGVSAVATQGGDGEPSQVGPFSAPGGGGGGGYTPGANATGRDGGSGGGGGVYAEGGPGGLGDPYDGGNGAGFNGGCGGGGGAGGDGLDVGGPPYDGGQGGPGVTVDVPGVSAVIAAGGPGGSYSGARPAYLPGAGPASIGGGGRGGCNAGVTGAGDAGGNGRVWVWYSGEPRATGGTVTQVDGFTIHDFSADGALAAI